jgi:hypothetical protein
VFPCASIRSANDTERDSNACLGYDEDLPESLEM